MNGGEIYATAVPVGAPQMALDGMMGGQRPRLPPRQPSNYKLPPSTTQLLPSPSVQTKMTQDQIMALRDQGFTTGLAKALGESRQAFPLRIWVVDNSGSMQKDDGHRIVETKSKNHVKIVECTRWAEIQECVNYHSQLAALLKAPTSFRLLNDPGAAIGPQQFGIAENGAEEDVTAIDREYHFARQIMNKTRPGGVTPLTQHMIEIEMSVRSMAPQLTADGRRVAIIIATDGLPTDDSGRGGEYENQRFVSSLRALEGLPVWVVIRLCTDEENVVEFYNDLDEQLELSIEVLDDFVGEAEEVHGHNPWLNYALPLHRCREMGFHDRVFDMVDERALTKGELRDFCTFLFGVDDFDSVPDPAGDWHGFISEIDRLLKKEKLQWNPMKKKLCPWIDVKKLHKKYGDGSACCIM